MRSRNSFMILLIASVLVLACQLALPQPTPLISPELPLITQIVTVEVTSVVAPTSPTPVKKMVAQGVELPIPRSQHTATQLEDGRILLVGGSKAPDDFLAEVDIYDPASGRIQSATPLHTGRHGHSATLLDDGRVLVVGGYNARDSWLIDAEIFDPARNTWSVTFSPFPHGVGHTATRMSDGRVLVVGGCTGSGVCTERVDIFDASNNSWQAAASLPSDRASHAAVLLQDGRVLIIGGGSAAGIPLGGDAMIYDPIADAWATTAPMITPRLFTQCVLLRDGRVLASGGTALSDPTNETMVKGTEIFEPDSMIWIAAADLNQPRYGHTLVMLNNGKVLAIGGTLSYSSMDQNSYRRQIEVYNAATNTWTVIGELPYPRVYSTTTLLPNGDVWMAGGQFLNRSRPDTWLINVQ
jgi:N-acetylneuraminic acid mutarotase